MMVHRFSNDLPYNLVPDSHEDLKNVSCLTLKCIVLYYLYNIYYNYYMLSLRGLFDIAF